MLAGDRREDHCAPDLYPILLYQEPGLIERTARDFLTEEVDRILVDKPENFKLVQDLVGEVSPRSRSRIEMYADPIPVLECYNIERQRQARPTNNVG